jgi:hypothetical protein
MNWMISNIIAPLQIFKIAGDSLSFGQWLIEYHNITLNDYKIRSGYKFFLECAFSSFFYGVAKEDCFGINDDFLLKTAIGYTSLEKLPNTCSKTIFLKNIYNHYKPIKRGKSASEIQNRINTFFSKVGSYFELFFEKNYELSKKQLISYEESIRLNQIECLYILFAQIENGMPVAYNGSLLKDFYVEPKKLDQSFEGFKYTLQYLWYKVIGGNIFETSSLKGIHLADSWSNYKYIKEDVIEHPSPMLSGRDFNLEEQSCLDSYFYRIKEEIITPIEKGKKLNILSVSDLFQPKGSISTDGNFETLLSNNDLVDPYNSLTDNEKLDIAFYWYPIEVFEPGKLHNGIAAFITTLVGTVMLNNSTTDNEFDNIKIRKFTHPHGDGKNDYSFGVLIDTKAASGHFTSGWLIYYDCCGDYSGFSGSQYKRAQDICKEYAEKTLIEFKEIDVDKQVFARYIAKHIITYDDLTDELVREKEEELEKQSTKQDRNRESFYSTVKKLVLEQLIYYAYNRDPLTKSVKWSVGKDVKEVDILVEYISSKKCIECKWNPNSFNLEKEYNKLIEKQKEEDSKERPEFWFWIEPSKKNTDWLIKNRISFFFINGNPNLPKLLNGVDLSDFRTIMDFLQENSDE